MKRILGAILSITLISSLLPCAVSADDSTTQTISYNYSYDYITGYSGEDTKTRQMEKLDRGLIAIKTNDGVYLSWRLFDSEDTVYGSAESNVSFDIYRDDLKIATVSNKTNYIDAVIGKNYSVAPVTDETEGEKCEPVTVMDNSYFDIPLTPPASETIYDPSGNKLYDASFFPADCSTGDVDGDGEYEIIVKWTSSERDVGSPGDPAYSGTVRFAAYKLDGTKLWDNDINLGKNVYSSAHTAQFLVYDFDGDGKSEMMVQTSLGSKDAKGKYVSHVSANETISAFTDEDNESADFRGYGRITTGEEFLTVFNGETGEAIDTITLPTSRGSENGVDYGDDFGNRSNRFIADVAYLDGVKPYAVYLRGYYFGKNYKQRTSIAGISFDGKRLSPDYRFDTQKGYTGYYDGAYQYVGQGNHNCTVADVDNDGKDEFITGALCMEVDDNNDFKPRWCTYLQHGDALHIGDYDPTRKGLEFFTVHEDEGTNTLSGTDVTMDFGMSVIDADTGEIIFHMPNTKDTGRGVMANTGSGGYYQITGVGSYQCNGGTNFTPTDNGAGSNFRIFWDGDLYDELLDGVSLTNWNEQKNTMDRIVLPTNGEFTKINGTKANPALQADLFGDWREELIYPTNDGNNLRVFTTTTPTDYKIKTLMHDPVYRSGVAAEQTAYNQPPHVGFYMAEDVFEAKTERIEITASPEKTIYALGENLDTAGLEVTALLSDGTSKIIKDYELSGFDKYASGEQTVIVSYKGCTAEFKTNTPSGFAIDDNGYVTSYTGNDEIVICPSSVNGKKLIGFSQNSMISSGVKKIYFYQEPVAFEAGTIFPDNITIACYKNSTAHEYAVEAGINVEFIGLNKTYADITADESEYSAYNDSDSIVYQHDKQAWTVDMPYATYGVGARSNNDGGDTLTGIYKRTDESGNAYLEARAGQFSTVNRHAYMTFTDVPVLSESGQCRLSFDFSIPNNSNNMSIVIANGKDFTLSRNSYDINTNVNTIYAIQAGKDNVLPDTPYHYELTYVNGEYSQTITNTETNNTITPALNNRLVPGAICFPCTGTSRNQYVSAYIDNILFSSDLASSAEITVVDPIGTLVADATVTLNDTYSAVTDENGKVKFNNIPSGAYSAIVSYNNSEVASSRFLVLDTALKQTITLDKKLAVPCTLSLMVTDKNNIPVSNASITLETDDEDIDTSVMSVLTDSSGNAVFTDIPNGIYTAKLQYSDWTEIVREIPVTQKSVYEIIAFNDEFTYRPLTIEGKNIHFELVGTEYVRVFAVKYNDNQAIQKIIEIKKLSVGENTLKIASVGFTPDKLFIWNEDNVPLSQTATFKTE